MRPHIVLPTYANLRFYRRVIAVTLTLTGCMFAIGLFGMAYGLRGGRSPVAILLGSIGFVSALVVMRGTAATLEKQIRMLVSYGKRYAVTRLRTERMQRGQLTHWHVIVATWIDEQGQPREALSDPFHYDPSPLLDSSRVTVLAHRYEPELCLVHPEGLPPSRKWQLSAAQAGAVEAHAPTPPWLAMLWALTVVAGILVLGMFTWLVSRLV